MAGTIRDVMTANPKTLDTSATVVDAARVMRDADIGDVLVVENDQLKGIVTDRDIVIRALAEGSDPSSTSLGDICSGSPTALSPQDSVEDAVRIMGDNAIRRLPIVENGRPVGIVSIGDLAVDRDPDSALAEISAATPDE